jgi:hypothetical protein
MLGRAAEPEEDERPWERPGATRRDCEPHRGRLLKRLAGTALILGILSWLCPPCALAAVPLGALASGLARRDLTWMRKGLMDRRAEWTTHQAQADGKAGLVLGAVMLLLWSLLFVVSAVLAVPHRPRW